MSEKKAVFSYMRVILIISSTFLLCIPSTSFGESPEERGFEIAARSDRSDTGYGDSRVKMTMILRNAAGDETTRSINFTTLERDNEDVGDQMQKYMEEGFHHIRVQVSTPGYATYGNSKAKTGNETKSNRDVSKGPISVTDWVTNLNDFKEGTVNHPGGIFEPVPYMYSALSLFEYIRDRFGYGVEILHDVHERISPIQGVWFAKQVEKYRLFFLEDLFSPEDQHYFEMVRQQCATPSSHTHYDHDRSFALLPQRSMVQFVPCHLGIGMRVYVHLHAFMNTHR